jgi:hypothetical protein
MNLFLNFFETFFKYLIMPVAVVFLRLAFCPHSNDLSFVAGYPHQEQAWKRYEHYRQSVVILDALCVACGRRGFRTAGKAYGALCVSY